MYVGRDGFVGVFWAVYGWADEVQQSEKKNVSQSGKSASCGPPGPDELQVWALSLIFSFVSEFFG